MTIESGNVNSRFHFDFSSQFSKSVSSVFSNNARTNTPEQFSSKSGFYTQANSLNILERTLSDGLGKRVDLDANRRDIAPARSIAKSVLSFVRQELREARNNGASEQELQGLLDQARKGIEAGFASAKDVLQGRRDVEPRFERQIERAYNRIQRGLERIDNRFAPNVAASSIDTPSENAEANEQNNLIKSQYSPLQTQQIEYLKTRDVQRSRSFDLSINTQEGDTVTFNVEQFFNKQVTKEATFNSDGFTVNIDRNVERGREVSYQVSGDINEKEQAAIDALIKKVDQLADKFYSGNVAAAFRKATRIGIDSEQLANFSLNLQSSKTVEVSKTYREVQGISAAQQFPSPLETIGSFVGGISETANDEVVSNIVADPVPVTTELFKQIAVRDERYAQLILEQNVDVIKDISDLVEEQLAA